MADQWEVDLLPSTEPGSLTHRHLARASPLDASSCTAESEAVFNIEGGVSPVLREPSPELRQLVFATPNYGPVLVIPNYDCVAQEAASLVSLCSWSLGFDLAGLECDRAHLTD